MERTISTCGKCRAEQDVTAEVKKVRDALASNESADARQKRRKEA